MLTKNQKTMKTLKMGFLTALSAFAFTAFLASCNNTQSGDQDLADATRDSIAAAFDNAVAYEDGAAPENSYYPYTVEENGYTRSAANKGEAKKVNNASAGKESAETIGNSPAKVEYASPELHVSLKATINDLRVNRPPVFSLACLEEEHPLLCSNEMIETFVKDHIQYPEEAKDNGDDGLEYVTFRVTKAGMIDNITVRTKEQPCEGCALAAREVVAALPSNWAPALRNGKPVDVTITLPIRFETIQ